ncbi:MAG: hypothetical protein ACJ72H_26430 [Candidatus Sulfotelmatobacter sp.]
MAATFVFILRRRRTSDGSRQPFDSAFRSLARRPRLAVLSVGLGVVLVRVALIPVIGIPEPRWNDEFSYLLSGDTFAHGRLTNPTHPMWIHFETFHIIQHPTYMSMYPPAQGLVLAMGQMLGNPWIGQLLITAVMCSAMCWMLQAWVPPQWALIGAILATLRLGILSYWMNTYWCASVAALGGALVLGAWPRLRRNLHPRHGFMLALGLVLLANSRPYEGFVFSIPVAIAIVAWFIARPLQIKKAIPALVMALVVLAAGATATGFYYDRVTGSPWLMTYQVNRSQYSAAPYFLWQKMRPEPVYHHAVMRDYYRGEAREFQRNLTFSGYLQRGTQKFLEWWKFYLGPLLTVPLLALPWIIRQRKMRLPLAICAAMIAAFTVQTWTLPHYFSPAAGALYILLTQGLRHLYARRGILKDAALGIPILACAMIVIRVVAAATHTQIEPAWPRGDLERAAILRQLRAMPDEQLVIVRYGPDHDVNREWVWNRASIDSAKVVWARDMGDAKNQELLEYFKSRRAWQLDADDPSPKLKPYAAAPAP